MTDSSPSQESRRQKKHPLAVVLGDKPCQYLVEHPALSEELRDNLIALRNAENARLGAAPLPAGNSVAA